MFQVIKKISLCALVLSVASCTTGGKNHQYHQRISSTSQLPLNNKAGILVFRSANDVNVNLVTINVYVDGSYLTSLKRGEYQYVNLCPGQHHIEFAYANADPAYLKKLNRNKHFELHNNDVFYVEIVGDGSGHINMKRSSTEDVERALPNLHRQQRTISRVISGNNC